MSNNNNNSHRRIFSSRSSSSGNSSDNVSSAIRGNLRRHPSYNSPSPLGGESPGISLTPGLGLVDATQLSSTLSHQHQLPISTRGGGSDSLLFQAQQNDSLNKQNHPHTTLPMDIDPNSPAPPGSMGGGIIQTQRRRRSSIPPLNEYDQQHHHAAERPHLTLWDLIALGVGGTVGSGIFVLTGQIARNYSGPATFVSWALAGVAACTSALSLCELASTIPATGSTYVYCQVCLQSQTAAVAAAACLTLEYAVSGAAVARTWGDKVVWWISATFAAQDDDNSQEESHQVWEAWLLPFGVNLPALLISALSTLLLLMGVSESKFVANAITSLKMVLVLGMIVGGFCLWRGSTFLPSSSSSSSFMPFGVQGVLRGATSSFFGYLGYDEVCVVAGEALRPTVDVPRAILGTLAIVTVCYVLASIALVGMQPYDEINPTSGFPAAFASHGWEVASQLSAAGELITLPVVVLISLLAQPRLTVRLAEDGVLPMLFARRNADGNLIGGTLLWGVAMTVTAAVVPFTYLDDLISCGILVAFCLANSCLIVLRLREEEEQGRHYHPQPNTISSGNVMSYWLLVFNALCCFSSLSWSRIGSSGSGSSYHLTHILATLLTLAMFGCYLRIASMLSAACCGSLMSTANGVSRSTTGRPVRDTYDTVYSADEQDSFQDEPAITLSPVPKSSPSHFRTPCVPLIPCLGMMINWYLIAQLEWHGLVLLLVYLGGAVGLYRCCGRTVYTSSRSNNNSNNNNNHQQMFQSKPGGYNRNGNGASSTLSSQQQAYESVRPHSPTADGDDNNDAYEEDQGNHSSSKTYERTLT